MIKEIKIYSRFMMSNFVREGKLDFPYKSWYLISIHGESRIFLTPQYQQLLKKFGFKGGLSLEFWDVTNTKYPGSILFDKSHAKEVIDFVDKLQLDKNETTLVVHCDAGISRSGAVGTFVCDYLNKDYNEFIKQNPYIMANPYVLRVLRQSAGMVPSFGEHDGVAPIKGDGIIF